MGFKSISTRRTSATSAVSNQATVINTGTGNLSVGGGAITATTSITLGVTTPGQSSANSSVAAQGGPVISSIVYLDANNNPSSANAVSTSGGNIRITGTGFVTSSQVYINNSLVTNTFVSSTQITAICPAASAGNVTISLFSPTDVGTRLSNGVRYSGAPTWTTAAASLVNGAAANIALVASSDSTLTFTLQAGSTLPTNVSLQSNGYLTGTPTGYSTTTAISVVIVATDQENQATQQTINLTVTVGDDFFKYTTLLLNGDTGTNTANAATNNTFLDSSSTNLTITRNGNTTQGTFSPFSQTGWSTYFDGGGNYLTTGGTTIGTGAVTFEFWLYFTGTDGTRYDFIQGDSANWLLYRAATNVLTWFVGSARISVSGFTLAAYGNRWLHIAVCRSGTTTKLFINGSQAGSDYTNDTNNYTSTSMTIGKNAGALYYMSGYMSNYRIATTALYTTTFTPPTAPLTAISGTQILTLQSNRFIDNSGNNKTITLTGSPSIQAYSPFAPSAAYVASSNGGSAYFDGAGDYLSNTTNNTALQLSTGDYTVEFWLYPTSFAGTPVYWDFRQSNGQSGGALQIYATTAGIVTIYGGSSTATLLVTAAAAIPLNVWTHIALTRSGTSTKLFINGTQSGSTATDSTSYGLGALWLGTGAGPSANYITGYMSNARVVKGTAVYTTTFTPPTAPVAAIANTSLLTDFTNGGIVDAHSTTILETVGGAQLSTVVTKFGTASMSFNSASSQYLIGPADAASTSVYNFSNGDWTVEGWFYPASVGTRLGGLLIGYNTTNATASVQIDFTASNTVVGSMYSGASAFNATAPGTYSANTWCHVAIVRNGTNITCYLNGAGGTPTSVSTNAVNYTSGSTKLYIGNLIGLYFNGYMDDIRITKGFARYTANFTAPTSAFQGQ